MELLYEISLKWSQVFKPFSDNTLQIVGSKRKLRILKVFSQLSCKSLRKIHPLFNPTKMHVFSPLFSSYELTLETIKSLFFCLVKHTLFVNFQMKEWIFLKKIFWQWVQVIYVVQSPIYLSLSPSFSGGGKCQANDQINESKQSCSKINK